jgi:hypothetical protein
MFTLFHAQAWFPAHAEIWNAPTWFLSALTFAMLVLPHVLPAIAAMRKKGLKLLLVGVLHIPQPVAMALCTAVMRPVTPLASAVLALDLLVNMLFVHSFDRLLIPHTAAIIRCAAPWHVLCFGCLQVGLTLVSVVAKLAYSYDLGAWGFLEGMMSARNHPNILFWNITRFNPFYCMLEVGAIAGRSAGTLDDSTVVVSAHICSGSSVPLAVLRSQLLSPQTLSDCIPW